MHAGCREATTEYDYASIMHYKTQQMGFDGIKREVFTPLREVPAGVKIGQRVELSPGDVKGIRDFYQCGNRKISKHWCNRHLIWFSFSS